MFCCTPRKSTNPCQGRRRQCIIKGLCLNWGDAGGASSSLHQPRGLERPANPECFAARPGRAPTPARGDAGSALSRTCVLTVLVPCNGGSHEGPCQARRWQCERMTTTCPRRCRTTAIPKLLQTRQKTRPHSGPKERQANARNHFFLSTQYKSNLATICTSANIWP